MLFVIEFTVGLPVLEYMCTKKRVYSVGMDGYTCVYINTFCGYNIRYFCSSTT